ncbi:phospholipid/cholesterol/gamma-HCH transport system substrate-binding protein [Lebetimonas natsushimae]|uniref:Phospholipid/cholesterol/gamma-HCH transport system substrate-binding protein n=1 Tax=Lebetimonas natsushimae TaxID=1936991 RepID=A0A292YGM1_9BACT|nr:MlaD family protein [Lebetimonas natsushimae]GAX88133.1 phospholipid/cholesterol/gamma-HCH transport system substrate-binding protein [Lebetimonas natsushimae]
MKIETKVGIFVFLSILSILYLTFQVKSLQDFNQKGYFLYAYINDASGLEKKAKVKLRGVIIGKLEDLKLNGNFVKLKLFIKKNVKIPKDSMVTLAQDNMLGSKYIKIIPSNSNIYYSENEIIKKYFKSASLDDLMNNVNSAVDDIKVLIKKLNTALNKESINNFHQILANIKDASVNLKEVLKTANTKLPDLIDNANELVSTYKEVGIKIDKKIPSILNKADTLLAKLNKTGDTLNAKLGPTIDEYKKLGANANSILEDNKEAIRTALASAKDFFESGGKSFKKIDKLLASAAKSQIDVEFNNKYLTKESDSKSYVQIAYLPNPTKYYILGVTSSKDYSDANKINKDHEKNKAYLTAEYGKRFDNLLLRGGIIESTGGVGIDYFMNNDKLVLSSEIYDFNAVNDIRGSNPHLNLALKYIYLKHLEFLAGFENILNSHAASAFLGLGIKFRDNDLKPIISGGATSFLK